MLEDQSLIELILKHLPPSASRLRLLDVGGVVAEPLSAQRPDIQIQTASLSTTDWAYPPNSLDAVFVHNRLLKSDFLKSVLELMRSGGRLIVVNAVGEPNESQVRLLEETGYTRILVEPLRIGGVFIRGEKPHTTTDTLARIQQVAQHEVNQLDSGALRGRYIHLLIRQTPNKPAWKLQPDEPIQWRAVAVRQTQQTTVLAFSSLPKAVAFMQQAVLKGVIQDVNKVGKFKHHVVESWQQPIWGNPTLDMVMGKMIEWLEVDPSTAETPDE